MRRQGGRVDRLVLVPFQFDKAKQPWGTFRSIFKLTIYNQFSKRRKCCRGKGCEGDSTASVLSAGKTNEKHSGGSDLLKREKMGEMKGYVQYILKRINMHGLSCKNYAPPTREPTRAQEVALNLTRKLFLLLLFFPTPARSRKFRHHRCHICGISTEAEEESKC